MDPKLLDTAGQPLLTEQERTSGVPDWIREPLEQWPLAFIPAVSGHPDRFVLGDGKLHPMVAYVLLGPDWRTELTVQDLIDLAAGAYHAIAHEHCARAAAELIARTWLNLSAPYVRATSPGRVQLLH